MTEEQNMTSYYKYSEEDRLCRMPLSPPLFDLVNYLCSIEITEKLRVSPYSRAIPNKFLSVLCNILNPLFAYKDWQLSHSEKETITETLRILFLQRSNMSDSEMDAVLKYCTPDTKMLEFGSGFSTFKFANFCKSVHTVEHDYEWFSRVSLMHLMLQNVNQRENLFIYYGRGGSNTLPDKQKYNYYCNFLKFNNIHEKFDVVSIDGVARPHCALSILPYIHDETKVVISDFWRPKRHAEKNYSMVYEYYDEIESCKEGNTYVVLKKKPGA
jgi:hypothetical protein